MAGHLSAGSNKKNIKRNINNSTYHYSLKYIKYLEMEKDTKKSEVPFKKFSVFPPPLILQFQCPTPEGVQTTFWVKPSFKLAAFGPREPLILCNVSRVRPAIGL